MVERVEVGRDVRVGGWGHCEDVQSWRVDSETEGDTAEKVLSVGREYIFS